MKKYSYKTKVPFYQCDKLRRIKISSLLDEMIMSSGKQLSEYGFDENWLSSRKQGWVVTQYTLEQFKTIHEGDDIIVSTWIEQYNRFFSYRNFEVTDLAGNVLTKLRSAWVIFDLKERKLGTIPEEIMKALDAKTGGVIKTYKFDLSPEEAMNSKRYNIRFSDLDTNNHITNTVYVDWMLDSLGFEFLENHDLKNLEIRFEKEILSHDFIEASYLEMPSSEGKKFYHQVNSKANIACQAITIWN